MSPRPSNVVQFPGPSRPAGGNLDHPDGPAGNVVQFPGPLPGPPPEPDWTAIWALSDLEALRRGLPPELRVVR